jgi:hypothetical protein
MGQHGPPRTTKEPPTTSRRPVTALRCEARHRREKGTTTIRGEHANRKIGTPQHQHNGHRQSYGPFCGLIVVLVLFEWIFTDFLLPVFGASGDVLCLLFSLLLSFLSSPGAHMSFSHVPSFFLAQTPYANSRNTLNMY